ncbi:putative bacteriophage tail protein [Yersinia pseudotuberculosis]|nr:putative bacteriophage tail protein [Yersinia pseudotuberculosis]
MNDDLTLEVGGRAITGWSKVKVTRSIEKLPSSFELSLMDRYPASGGQQWVNPGDPCVVKLGNDSVLNGYIDSWDNAITATTHVVSAMGRGKCQDLVDCSAKWPNSVISQSTVLQIAQKLAEPYGITVTSDITDMTIVPTFTLNWGETAQTVIENVTRWAALLYYDQLDGNLLLTRVGNRKAASGVAQGVNILSARLHTDINKRFVDYTGVVLSTNAVARRSPSGGTIPRYWSEYRIHNWRHCCRIAIATASLSSKTPWTHRNWWKPVSIGKSTAALAAPKSLRYR